MIATGENQQILSGMPNTFILTVQNTAKAQSAISTLGTWRRIWHSSIFSNPPTICSTSQGPKPFTKYSLQNYCSESASSYFGKCLRTGPLVAGTFGATAKCEGSEWPPCIVAKYLFPLHWLYCLQALCEAWAACAADETSYCCSAASSCLPSDAVTCLMSRFDSSSLADVTCLCAWRLSV